MLDPSIIVGPHSLAASFQGGSTSPSVPVAPQATERVQAAESRARALATAIEMLSELDTAETLDEAGQHASNWLANLVSAKRLLLLWRQRVDGPLQLVADSHSDAGRPVDDRVAVAAGEEVASRQEVAEWPPLQSSDRHALLAVAQLVGDLAARSLLGVAMPDSSGRARGVVIAVDAVNNGVGASAGDLLLAISGPLASRLASIQRMQPKPMESLLRGITDAVHKSRRKVVLGMASALTLIMLLPLPYKVRADLELQPIQHRFVAVPFDGPLESAEVRPGDLVDQGDLLATINPRELEYELAGVRAEWHQSLQQKKGLMAEHDFAGSKIAALESDRLRLQSELLKYRRDNLEIRSPISGVVVSGDLKQSEGMPMSRGETLFQIAPLGQMVVQIAVAEDDVAHVRQGMPVEFFVHAIPTRKMNGFIDRLHPRAELRDHENVYIAEVRIRDPENVLRPGMRGKAKIQSDRHTLAWNLFHKAWFALRASVLGW